MGSRRRSAPQVSDLIDTEGVTRARLFTSAGRSKKFAASSSSLHNGASNPRTSSHGRSGEEPIKPKRAAPISKGECNCNAKRRFVVELACHCLFQRRDDYRHWNGYWATTINLTSSGTGLLTATLAD